MGKRVKCVCADEFSECGLKEGAVYEISGPGDAEGLVRLHGSPWQWAASRFVPVLESVGRCPVCDENECTNVSCAVAQEFPAAGKLDEHPETPPPHAQRPEDSDEFGAFVLPTDSEERKEIPIFSGVLNYFPLAVAAVARHSKRGNDKHNPGEPLHWARGKSMDHEDCIARHLLDIDTVDPETGEYLDAVALAWRALAKLQELEEKRLGKPMSRGSRRAA
jgi:hypothetical protein